MAQSRVQPPSLGFVSPQVPTLVTEPPDKPGWLHEIKHDGYRALIVNDRGKVRGFSRQGNDWTARWASVIRSAARLPCTSAIIDGEIVVQDGEGRSDFLALRAAMEAEPHRLILFAFDLLHLDGRDLRDLPLVERRAELAKLLSREWSSHIQLSEEAQGSGAEIFAAAGRLGLEGIVSKRANSPYRSGRQKTWLKVKCMAEEPMVLLGTELDGKGVPVALLARERCGRLEYAGGANFALPAGERESFRDRVEALRAERPILPGLARKRARWIRPEVLVNVRYLRGEGGLRHATVRSVIAT